MMKLTFVESVPLRHCNPYLLQYASNKRHQATHLKAFELFFCPLRDPLKLLERLLLGILSQDDVLVFGPRLLKVLVSSLIVGQASNQ